MPWAGKLWAVTYSPHMPRGSDDKLYAIDDKLQIRPFSGSIGGTPANRMIHRESKQLIIGPYFIDAKAKRAPWCRTTRPWDGPRRPPAT